MKLFAHLFASRNPARELSLIGHEKRRQDVRAVARQMCREMGRPIPEALQ
jgi:hypothetical protein